MKAHGFLVHFVLLILAIIIISIQPKIYVNAKAFAKYVEYHVAVINNLSNDTLDVHCKGDDGEFTDLKLQHVQVNANFTFDLRTAFTYTVSYECVIDWVEGGEIKFESFRDTSKFLDDGCGGLHCFWKATNFGLYLFQIQKQTYVFKFGWPGKGRKIFALDESKI
ncbi:S-protein homolog 74-like [Chenopodium quinoa]|uniref:S-protein homolog 74-like n=1 Tax=Chenopodium quinoa TaxID=63459 RepID=UPI000B7920A8|nr:S-protein homolog 74-like [Chenopodium quinoa]